MPDFLTNDFALIDPTDQSKQLRFNVSSIGTGTIRTLNVPYNGNGTMVIAEHANSFTGVNTFTAGGLITGVPITFADSSDNSKQLILTLSGMTTGQTATFTFPHTGDRSFEFPDASIVLAGSTVALTPGRVTFATTGGLLIDDADLTFATDTLTVTKIAATTFTGNVTLSTKDLVTDTTTGTKVATGTTQKLAFHNSTPVVQRSGASQAAVATTGATNVAPYGYTTAAQADAIITLLNEIRATLVEKGLMAGA